MINCGDAIHSANSNISSSSSDRAATLGTCWDDTTPLTGEHCSNSCSETPSLHHQVLLLGAAGVGKTTLAQQFLTSECLINNNHIYGNENVYYNANDRN